MQDLRRHCLIFAHKAESFAVDQDSGETVDIFNVYLRLGTRIWDAPSDTDEVSRPLTARRYGKQTNCIASSRGHRIASGWSDPPRVWVTITGWEVLTLGGRQVDVL
jgi:hypothetical protein